MADWSGVSRTNYVEIKSFGELLEAVRDLPLTVDRHPEKPNFVSFAPGGSDDGDFNYCFIDDNDDEIEWWWPDLAHHMVEWQVLVVKTAGSEKMRYLTGVALAVAWDGRTTSVNLNDIYAKAAQAFEVDVRTIAECTYQRLPEVMPEGSGQ